MGKIIVDALVTEVNEKELVPKSKASLVVGQIATPEKKAIDTKEEELKKVVAANKDNIENISTNPQGNVEISYKDEKEDKEKEDREEKEIEQINEEPVMDDGDELII